LKYRNYFEFGELIVVGFIEFRCFEVVSGLLGTGYVEAKWGCAIKVRFPLLSVDNIESILFLINSVIS